MKSSIRSISVTAFFLITVGVVTGCDSDSGGSNPANGENSSNQVDSSNAGGAGGGSNNTENSSGDGGNEGDGGSPDNTVEGDGSDGTEVPTQVEQSPDPVSEQEARYRVQFISTWSANTHPTNFPDDPHFSPVTGVVHNEQVQVWKFGQIASDGIKEMAETGGTSALADELQAAIDEGYGLSLIQGEGVSRSPGRMSVEFDVSRSYPLVTLVSMLAPSPDWFIGVEGFNLIDDNGNFVQSITRDLKLYDAGTDSGVTFTSADDQQPRSPIGYVNSFPSDANFLEGEPFVGQMVFEKIQ